MWESVGVLIGLGAAYMFIKYVIEPPFFGLWKRTSEK